MDISSFVCKRCGADVEIGADGKIATCKYCGGKYNIDFSDGSLSARPIDKDIDSRVKGLIHEKKELEERLEKIEEGEKKWKLFLSSFYAGKGKNIPEMKEIHEEAKSDFIMGYGIENRKLVSDYCNITYLDAADSAASPLSCDVILIGTIIVVCILGAIFMRNDVTRLGIILLSSGGVLFVFLLFGLLGERGGKKEDRDRKEAKKGLKEIEKAMRKRLDSF